MISNAVYNPYLKKLILIKASNIQVLKEYIRISKEIQVDYLYDSEKWHAFQALIDAYEETLDSVWRYDNAI